MMVVRGEIVREISIEQGVTIVLLLMHMIYNYCIFRRHAWMKTHIFGHFSLFTANDLHNLLLSPSLTPTLLETKRPKKD